MPQSSDNGLLTSPSFLQSVLSSNVEAELSELYVNVKEVEKNIQLLTVQVHEDLTGRYINFDKFDIADDDYLHTAQKLIQDLEDIAARITDGQNQADDKESTQEFQNLHDALQDPRTAVLFTYQLLSIDCALKSLIEALEKHDFLEAAICYSKIPPMFHEISECGTILDALRKECNIRCEMLNIYLGGLWRKIVSWHETGESLSSKTKSVSLKMLKDQELSFTDILTALFFAGTLESNLSIFGKSLLQLVFFPILTKVTTVVKDSKGPVQISVQISGSKEKPRLVMILANLKDVFQFLFEEMNVELGSGVTSLSTLGALVSNEFSKVFLKECLTESSKSAEKNDNVCDNLDELQDLVAYLTQIGFLQCDNLTQYVTKLMNSCDENSAFWECERLLERARFIMKGDINDTLLIQQDSLDNCGRNYQNGTNSEYSVDQKNEQELSRGTIAFPSCRVSKWIVELVELLQEVLTVDSEGADSNQRCEFLKTARRIVELYAAFIPVRHRGVIGSPPSSVGASVGLTALALFYNNTMFLANQLVLLEFGGGGGKHSANPKVTSIDLIQHLRSIAISSFLKYVQKQRTAMVENTKEIDLLDLNDLEHKVKLCILQADQLSLAWKGVLPAPTYAKAMGGILDSWLDELIKLFGKASTISENTARNIKLVFRDITLRISFLFEGLDDVPALVSRLSRFEALIDILDSSLTEIALKWTNGSLAREFGPQHVQQFVRVLFGLMPGSSQVLSQIK